MMKALLLLLFILLPTQAQRVRVVYDGGDLSVRASFGHQWCPARYTHRNLYAYPRFYSAYRSPYFFNAPLLRASRPSLHASEARWQEVVERSTLDAQTMSLQPQGVSQASQSSTPIVIPQSFVSQVLQKVNAHP